MQMQFHTDTPLEHLSRVLDELRRAGAWLERIECSPVTGSGALGLSLVTIDFQAIGTVQHRTVTARIASVHGIQNFQATAEPQAAPLEKIA